MTLHIYLDIQWTSKSLRMTDKIKYWNSHYRWANKCWLVTCDAALGGPGVCQRGRNFTTEDKLFMYKVTNCDQYSKIKESSIWWQPLRYIVVWLIAKCLKQKSYLMVQGGAGRTFWNSWRDCKKWDELLDS